MARSWKRCTYCQEDFQIATEAGNRAARGEEREHVVGAVRSGVNVPGMTRKTDALCNGDGAALGVVVERDGPGVEVGEPDHDLVHVRTPSRIGGEEVVSHVSDNRAGGALRPLPSGL